MRELRPYQVKMLKAIQEAFEGGKQRVLCCLPTGAGKTEIALNAIDRHVRAGGRAFFLADRRTIVKQTMDALARGYDHHRVGVVWAEEKEDRSAPVQVCSVDTLLKRAWWREHLGSPDSLFVCDEAHAKTVWGVLGQTVQRELGQSRCLMLTATPDRLDVRESFLDIGDVALIQGPKYPYRHLERGGWLVPARYFQCKAVIDVAGVETVAGDFEQQQLARAANRDELIRGMLDLWMEKERGRRTVAFCTDVKHAEAVAAAWSAAGHPAGVIVGETTEAERVRLFEGFEKGEVQLLATCGALTYGWDCPPVEVGLLMRPTQSWMLYFQIVGRMLRVSPETGKSEARIYDQTLNVLSHGMVGELKAYELRPARQPRCVSDAPQARVCSACGALNPVGARVCSACGAPLTTAQAKKWIKGFKGYRADEVLGWRIRLEPGTEFGKWTVIEEGPQSRTFDTVYRVQCSCKKRTVRAVKASALVSGHSQSCGCNGIKVRFDVGQLIGRLQVLEDGWLPNGRRAIHVKCSCGTLKWVPAGSLKKVRSCGCQVEARKSSVTVGQQFGKLTVISTDTVERVKSKQSALSCRVRCGCPAQTEKSVIITKLLTGKALSCGCSRIPMSFHAGEQIGVYVVLSPADPHPSGKGGPRWLVRCVCPEPVERVMFTSQLLQAAASGRVCRCAHLRRLKVDVLSGQHPSSTSPSQSLL